MRQKIAELLDVVMGFRKMIILLLLYIIGIWFRLKGYINGDNVVELLKYTTVSFFGANSVEHFTSMVQDHLSTKLAILQQTPSDEPEKEEPK